MFLLFRGYPMFCSEDFKCIFFIVHWFLLIFIDLRSFSLISIDFHVFSLIFIDFHWIWDQKVLQLVAACEIRLDPLKKLVLGACGLQSSSLEALLGQKVLTPTGGAGCPTLSSKEYISWRPRALSVPLYRRSLLLCAGAVLRAWYLRHSAAKWSLLSTSSVKLVSKITI